MAVAAADEHAGRERGYVAGYEEAKDEVAAASWAATREGKMARTLAEAGSIDSLFRCDRPGWVLEDGACRPKATSDGTVYGWWVRP